MATPQYQDPGLAELQRATSIWEDVGSTPVVYGYQKQTGDMPILERQISTGSYGGGGAQQQASRISRPTRSYGGGGGGSYGASATVQQKYTPVQLSRPGDLKMPEYKPPERDEMQEKKFRREYMGPGMAQIRRSTQEAIISSKSFDNPNARALFIRDALRGVGEGIEKVATGAGREARAEASRRYQEDIANYIGQWNAKAQEATAKYDADWKAALAEFSEKQYAARQGYQVDQKTGAGGTETAGVQQPRVYRMSRYGGLKYA